MRYAAYLSKVPRDTLFPIVFLFCIVGSYAISNSLFDVGIVVFFGAMGYYMQKFGFSVAPFLIAFLLAPIGETAARQALLISVGSLSIFFTKPISLLFFIITVLSIAGILYSHYRRREPERPPIP
jgi:putative tricarboxylic transport membrane protein